jgi:hypothetical protein
MYEVLVRLEGISPLLQHRFAGNGNNSTSKKKNSKAIAGEVDYSEEWRSTCYVNNLQEVYIPSAHLEGALVKAAVQFKIKGKRGKTFKDLCRAAVFVDPATIPFSDGNGGTLKLPKEPPVIENGEGCDAPVYVDERDAVVQRNRIIRNRLAVNAGWQAQFSLQVADDGMPIDTMQQIMTEAGLRVGIGDYRPRFGRFRVVRFEEVSDNAKVAWRDTSTGQYHIVQTEEESDN